MTISLEYNPTHTLSIFNLRKAFSTSSLIKIRSFLETILDTFFSKKVSSYITIATSASYFIIHSYSLLIKFLSIKSSESTNDIYRPLHFSNPAFLAEESPPFFLCITVILEYLEDKSSHISGQLSGDPSSTSIISIFL